MAALPVTKPPLRSHPEDIAELARHFAARVTNPNFDAKLVEFAPDALSVMRAFRWLGNLVESSQVVMKIASSCAARVITSDELPRRLKEASAWPTLR